MRTSALLFATLAMALPAVTSPASSTEPSPGGTAAPAASTVPPVPVGVRSAATPTGTLPDGSLNVGELHAVTDGSAKLGNHTVDQLRGKTVHDKSGKRIGEIAHVLADPSGKIVAVTVELGRLLGIGTREHVVDLSQFRPSDDRTFIITLTEDELKQRPGWIGLSSERGGASPGQGRNPEPK